MVFFNNFSLSLLSPFKPRLVALPVAFGELLLFDILYVLMEEVEQEKAKSIPSRVKFVKLCLTIYASHCCFFIDAMTASTAAVGEAAWIGPRRGNCGGTGVTKFVAVIVSVQSKDTDFTCG